MYVKLNPGITPLNLVSFYLMTFVVFICLSFILSFVTYILTDENYYAVPIDEIGSKLGQISCIAEIFVIFESLFMGPIFDKFGRKVPLVISFIVTGLAIGAIPLFKTLYPGYFILRVLISLGTTIGLNAPLLPDYVDKNSVGVAFGQVEVLITISYFLTQFGLL